MWVLRAMWKRGPNQGQVDSALHWVMLPVSAVEGVGAGVGEQVSSMCGCWRPRGGGSETQASGTVGVDDQPANVCSQPPGQAKRAGALGS